MYIPIIGELIGLGKTYIEGKQKKSQAKAEAEATVLVKAAEHEANWENIMAKNSGESWKDEYLIVILTIPAIMCFFPGGPEIVKSGFDALSMMPDYYQHFLYLGVTASFGIKGFKAFKGSK
jgi:hypothetical protein